MLVVWEKREEKKPFDACILKIRFTKPDNFHGTIHRETNRINQPARSSREKITFLFGNYVNEEVFKSIIFCRFYCLYTQFCETATVLDVFVCHCLCNYHSCYY